MSEPEIKIQPPAKITIERPGMKTEVFEGVQEYVLCGLMAHLPTGCQYGFHHAGGNADLMDLASHCWAAEQRLIGDYGSARRQSPAVGSDLVANDGKPA